MEYKKTKEAFQFGSVIAYLERTIRVNTMKTGWSFFILSAVLTLSLSAFYTAENEVVIGNQTWMSENLDVAEFRTGDPILQVTTKAEWQEALTSKTPAWCYYNYKEELGKKYGKIYNQYAVRDSRGLAPTGWRIPSHFEWNKLIDHLGGASVAGGKLKATEGWITTNGEACNGTNTSQFNCFPGGYCHDKGSGSLEGRSVYFWCKTAIDDSNSHSCFIGQSDFASVGSTKSDFGMYVRCIK